MNRITEQGKNASTVLMGIILLTGVIAFSANPQIAYSNHPALDPITVTSPNDEIEKTVSIGEETHDGVITVGEVISYDFLIEVINNGGGPAWINVIVQDRLGGNLGTDTITVDTNLICTLGTPDTGGNNGKKKGGKTQKEFLDCIVDGDGNLDDGEQASVSFSAETDVNPGQKNKNPPKNEYTSCGEHAVNSGATITYTLSDGTIVSASTGSATVDVFELADLSGDCDQDGIPDSTDPFPFDFDGDGVNGLDDNCPNDANAGQEDADGDGKGDACDNAPNDFNPNQKDADGDGVGDVADLCPNTPKDAIVDSVGCTVV